MQSPISHIPTAMLENIIKRGKYERFETLPTPQGLTVGQMLQCELNIRRYQERKTVSGTAKLN